MDSIFISIAACKEEFLVQTIKSAMANASNPELLYFGICNMVVDKEDYLIDPVFDLDNVNYVETKHKGPLGTGIGRMMSSLMFDREHKYFLQVDAHTIFTKDWDRLLKSNYDKLLEKYDKPIISASPQWWAENDKKEIMLFDNPEEIIDPYNFTRYAENSTLEFRDNKSAVNELMNNDGTSLLTKYGFVEGCDAGWKEDEEFKEHGLIHAAFVFFSFNFLKELISDPFNPWDGDQTNISFRAGTRGYRIFTIKEACIWSKNKYRKDKLISNYDWRTSNTSRTRGYFDKKAIDHQVDMFSGNYLGFWGSPDKESIDKYERFLGFKFSNKFIKRLDSDNNV